MQHKKISFLLAALALLVFSSYAAAAIPVEVQVGKGTIVTLKEKSKRVSLSDPAIADLILISPTELLINGKQVGSTSLIIWDDDSKRTFFDVYVVADMGALVDQIAEIAPDDDVTVEMSRESIVLKGTLTSQHTINKIVAVSKTYSEKIVNFMLLEKPQQVMLEVKVAQIDKTAIKKFGINAMFMDENVWAILGLDHSTEEYPGDLLLNSTPEFAIVHAPSGIAAALKALATKGFAKILAEPNLVVRSGETGEFLVGSEIPIPIISGTGGDQSVTVTYKEVGIKLHFLPEVLETGMIRLKIDPAEVSNIARFVEFSSGIAPVIETRRVTTSVDLKAGESLVLAGLLSDQMKKNMRKIPLFGDIPILGAFFRMTDDEMVQTELTFFITPRLVNAVPEEERPEHPGEREITDEEKRQLRWIPIPKGIGGSKSAKTETGEGAETGAAE